MPTGLCPDHSRKVGLFSTCGRASLAYMLAFLASVLLILPILNYLCDVITWTGFRCGRQHGHTERRQGRCAGGVTDAERRSGEGRFIPAFTAGSFFDPADLLQVKYEMVRQVEVEGVPVSPRRPRRSGSARQSAYNARAALAAGGLAALIPGKPGPKRGSRGKAAGPVWKAASSPCSEPGTQAGLRRLYAQAGATVRCSGGSPLDAPGAGGAELAGRDAGTAGPAAPKSGQHG